MRISATVAALAMAASAQVSDSVLPATVVASASLSSAPAPTPVTASTSGPVTHTIAVAKGGHSFSPDVTLAEVGDVIGKDHRRP